MSNFVPKHSGELRFCLRHPNQIEMHVDIAAGDRIRVDSLRFNHLERIRDVIALAVADQGLPEVIDIVGNERVGVECDLLLMLRDELLAELLFLCIGEDVDIADFVKERISDIANGAEIRASYAEAEDEG